MLDFWVFSLNNCSQGALTGMISATFGTVWIFCGKIVYSVPEEFRQPLPLYVRKDAINSSDFATEDPSVATITDLQNITLEANMTQTTSMRPRIADLYSLSYMYQTAFGFLIGMSVGIIVSLLSGK